MSLLTRRRFVETGSLAAAAGFARKGRCATASTPVGAQLYTVRNEVQTDLPGTLAALKKIGFAMVEPFSGMYQRPAAELRKMIEDAGLTAPSAHFAYDTLETQLEYAHALGVSCMVCAMLPKPYQNRDGFMKAAAFFNEAGSKAKAANIRLAFHNHNFEFQPLEPENGAAASVADTGFRILMDGTDPALVAWEEDCYWVAQAGENPLGLLEKYKKRVPLLHLKDRKAEATNTFTQGKGSQFFTEIGTGTIDWGPIIRIAQSTGAKLFVEQDTTAAPPLESLAISYRNLQRWVA